MLPHHAQPFLELKALNFAGPGGSFLLARREGREGAQSLKIGKSVGSWACKRTVLPEQLTAGDSPAELTAFEGWLLKNASSYLGKDTWDEFLLV